MFTYTSTLTVALREKLFFSLKTPAFYESNRLYIPPKEFRFQHIPSNKRLSYFLDIFPPVATR